MNEIARRAEDQGNIIFNAFSLWHMEALKKKFMDQHVLRLSDRETYEDVINRERTSIPVENDKIDNKIFLDFMITQIKLNICQFLTLINVFHEINSKYNSFFDDIANIISYALSHKIKNFFCADGQIESQDLNVQIPKKNEKIFTSSDFLIGFDRGETIFVKATFDFAQEEIRLSLQKKVGNVVSSQEECSINLKEEKE